MIYVCAHFAILSEMFSPDAYHLGLHIVRTAHSLQIYTLSHSAVFRRANYLYRLFFLHKSLQLSKTKYRGPPVIEPFLI